MKTNHNVVTCQKYFSNTYPDAATADVQQPHHLRRSHLLTAIFSVSGTHSHEGGYKADKEERWQNSSNSDSKHRGRSLWPQSGNFSCGRVKRKARATSYFGQSQSWGANQKPLYMLSLVQLRHPPTESQSKEAPTPAWHAGTDLRQHEGASHCCVLESRGLKDVPETHTQKTVHKQNGKGPFRAKQ